MARQERRRIVRTHLRNFHALGDHESRRITTEGLIAMHRQDHSLLPMNHGAHDWRLLDDRATEKALGVLAESWTRR